MPYDDGIVVMRALHAQSLPENKMPYAIYRALKLKSVGAISASASHNARSRMTPNADPARTPQNEQLVGFDFHVPSPETLVAAWREATKHAKRKPNAVLIQELFVGCSPEFFNAVSSDEKRSELRQAWQSRAVEWLQREFGCNLISVTLHLDETTPHLAAYVVPLMTAKDGSVWLSGKKVFNPFTLIQQQDRYAESVADLGLERGVRGSAAEHRTVQSFYGQIRKPLPLFSKITLAAVESKLSEKPRGFLEASSAYAERVVQSAQNQVENVIAAAREIEALAKDATSARRAETEVRASNQKLSKDLAASKSAFRNLTDQVRDIPLADVLVRLGWGDGKREGGSVMWRTGEHAISVTGEKWYDHKAGKGGGKSIDLVMHLMACPFAEAIGWLAGQWTIAQTAAAVRVAAEQLVAVTPKRTFTDLWTYFAKPDAWATGLAREYLIKSRDLAPDVIDEQIRAGVVYGSFQQQSGGVQRPWCVFRHLDGTGKTMGATLRGLTDEDQPKRCIGSKLGAFFTVGPAIIDADELVFVESPIDALSYYQRSRRARVVSVAGNSIPAAAIELILTRDLPVTVALDNDSAGRCGWDSFVDRVKAMGELLVRRVRRVVPSVPGWAVKDWNDVLRAEVYQGESRGVSPKLLPADGAVKQVRLHQRR